MRGEFDRLVAAPSAREMDAALAEVKVRAVPIARRRARQQRQLVALGLIALAVGGAALGRVTAPGLRILPDEGGAVLAERVAPWLSELPGTASAESVSSLLRFHVRAWTEWEGVRYAESEGFIEGPAGVGFRLDGIEFTADVRPEVGADTTLYRLDVVTHRAIGRSSDGLHVEVSGGTHRDVAVPDGRALVLAPLGRPGSGTPATYIRIDGPHASAPVRAVVWRTPDPAAANRWYYRRFDWRTNLEEEWRIAQRFGVRYARIGFGDVSLRPLMRMPAVRVRLTGPSTRPFELFVGWTGRVRFRAAAGELSIGLWHQLEEGQQACVVLMNRAREGWTGFDGNRVCFPEADPFSPVTIAVPGDERLTLQLLR